MLYLINSLLISEVVRQNVKRGVIANMKMKILVILITLFLCFGISVNTTAIEKNTQEDSEENYNQTNDVTYYGMSSLPPKPDYILQKMNPNPDPAWTLADLPSQFSWTNYNGNWLTPVKDQAYPVYCGSCYIFGSWGAFEAAIDIASGYPTTNIDLSEQYGLSCINSGCYGCNGGWGTTMIENMVSTGANGNGVNGVTIESCMPYQAVDYIPCSEKCSDWDYYTDPIQPDNKLWQVKNWGWMTTQEKNPSDWEMIKTWLFNTGPLAVTIAWDSGLQNFVDTHHSPNDVYQQDSSDSTNHIMVLCGWVDDDSILNGGYWILKNSHGTAQGYGGYVNLAYGCNRLGCSECIWITAEEWPEGQKGPGPGDVNMHVFCDFNFGPEYPHLGEEITFSDISDGEVTLREWDFNGDGVIDSTKKNPTYAFTKEGKYEVSLTVWSAWGLNNTRTRVIEVKEIWPPKAICTPEEYVDNELEYNFEGRFSYDVDGGKIKNYHWDFDDGTTSDESHVSHLFPEGDKIYEVKLTVTDDDGASSTTTCTVKIDITIPPTTSIIIGGTEDLDWYRYTQKIKFEAEDWTSVKDTFYRIDEGEWTRYVKSEQMLIPISTEGVHTVEYYSVDYYGNEEQVQSSIVRIDKTEPILDFSINGNQQDGWYDSQVDVTLSGDDSLSGLDLIIYKCDTGCWQEYCECFTLGDGIHRLWAYAIDKAGNMFGSDDPIFVNVDSDVPTTICNFVGEGSNGLFYKSVDIVLASSDSGSGIDKIYCSIDSSPFFWYDGAITFEGSGKHSVTYYAVDNLGNKEEQKTDYFSVLQVNYLLGMEKPGNHLYLFNMELFSLSQPLIIGAIDVIAEVEAFTSTPADVAYVEFLVDGTLKMTDSTNPFVWRLDGPMFGIHEIKVNAVNSEGESLSAGVKATFFII